MVKKPIGTHWIDVYVKGHSDAIYVYNFEFRFEHIPKEIKKTYRQQKYNNKYFQNTSIRFNNLSILLYWIY